MFYRLKFLFPVLFLLMASIVHAQVMCGDVITTNTILETDVGPCEPGPNNSQALTVQGLATLDLNSFTVFCDPQNRAEGIYLIGKGAKFFNGALKDCRSGVQIMGTGHHRETGMVSKDNSSGNCFKIHEGSNKNMLTDNSSHGLSCDNGFEILGDKNTLTKNVDSYHDDQGFENHGNENIFRENVAVNSGSGFSIDGRKNKVLMNLATDTSIGFILGNSGEGGYNNILKKNKAVANGIGIQIFTATDNLLEENFSIGNDIYDMVDDNDTCDNNTWLNNFFGTALVYDGDGDQTCIR